MFKQIADMFEQNNKLFVHIVKKTCPLWGSVKQLHKAVTASKLNAYVKNIQNKKKTVAMAFYIYGSDC